VKYSGRWRIVEMDNWDMDYVDMVGPGHITIAKRGHSEMKFGAVNCDLDCGVENFAGSERLEFSFLGMDEGDEDSGRGWAMLGGKILKGHIYFHHGDESGFVAKKRP